MGTEFFSSHPATMRVFTELQHAPWTSLHAKNNSHVPLFVKSKFTDACYYLIITDLLHVWFRFSDKKAIKEEKQAFNPQFSATTGRILEILSEHLVEQKPDATYECMLSEKKEKMILTLATKIDFYMFQWTFECDQMQGHDDCHSLYIRDHVIIPFIYTNKLLIRQMKGPPKTDNSSSLKRSKMSFVKTEDPTCNINNTLPTSSFCINSDEDFLIPSECLTHPWIDQFTSRAYQHYVLHANKQTTRTLSFSVKKEAEEGNSGEKEKTATDHDFKQPATLELVYTASSMEDDFTETQKNSHSCSSDYEEQEGTSQEDEDKIEKEENPEEVRRRKEIAERIEKEKAKKVAIQSKRKRFI